MRAFRVSGRVWVLACCPCPDCEGHEHEFDLVEQVMRDGPAIVRADEDSPVLAGPLARGHDEGADSQRLAGTGPSDGGCRTCGIGQAHVETIAREYSRSVQRERTGAVASVIADEDR